MSFIERVGQKRVGFSCWKLFTINYLRCYEVIDCLFFILVVKMLIQNKAMNHVINFFSTDHFGVCFAIH
jgi:hypothetical protein